VAFVLGCTVSLLTAQRLTLRLVGPDRVVRNPFLDRDVLLFENFDNAGVRDAAPKAAV
jgi:hypothetical protein